MQATPCCRPAWLFVCLACACVVSTTVLVIMCGLPLPHSGAAVPKARLRQLGSRCAPVRCPSAAAAENASWLHGTLPPPAHFGLNRHVWLNVPCNASLPPRTDPDIVDAVRELQSYLDPVADTAPRTFCQHLSGYLVPPAAGKYTLQLLTTDASWLRLEQQQPVLLASSNGNPASVQVELEAATPLALSVVHSVRQLRYAGGVRDLVMVRWSRGAADDCPVPCSSLLRQLDGHPNPLLLQLAGHGRAVRDYVSRTPLLSDVSAPASVPPRLAHDPLSAFLPTCEFLPADLTTPLNYSRGPYPATTRVWEMHHAVYPADLRRDVGGNNVMHRGRALGLAHQLVQLANRAGGWPGLGPASLRHVVRVETRDTRPWVAHLRIDLQQQWRRYLVELDLAFASGTVARYQRYVAMLPGSIQLCSPAGYEVDMGAHVAVVTPVRNQGVWFVHFVQQFVHIFATTHDSNFSLVVVDFGSTDVDVGAVLVGSGLPRHMYRVVRQAPPFRRAGGLMAGVEATAGDPIVFANDLHLQYPVDVLDHVRRHVARGRLVYAPVVLRMEPGAVPAAPKGQWESNGFGLLGMYKSDLLRVGGYDTQQFSVSWGGEDSDFVERLFQHGPFDFVRLRVPGLYHFHHNRTGMWDHAHVTFSGWRQ